MRKPPHSPPPAQANSPKSLRFLRWTLLLLVVELTFEGMTRKLNIGGSNVAIFVIKDVIIAAMGIQLLRLKRPPTIDFLWMAYLITMVLFLPLLLQTAAHDPILAVFGGKQYLLYPIVAFGVFVGFEDSSIQDIVRFFRWLALLVIPTALLALLQLRLPPTHWLNLSVDGGSLEGFSAGGHLRVSSTFSFVAQYCAFIDAEVFITMIALNTLRDVNWFLKLIYLSIVPLLIISSYITGSRGAVLVCCVIVGIAAVLCLLKFQTRSAMRVVFIIGGLLLTLVVVQFAFPDAFAAYSEREQGRLLGASDEIQQRILSSTFDWIGSIFTTPFFGYGLGIMSNGSELLSSYAATTRAFSWTETDFATTLFEGGIYLVVVWYGFRYFVIYQTLRRFLGMRGEELSVPGAFCLGFVILTGFTGTLAIQPPIAIWWWLSVGISLVICHKADLPKEIVSSSDEPPRPKPTGPRTRGQSAYAERLHAQRK